MKKILFLTLALSTLLFSKQGKFIEVISENIIKIEHNGTVERLHLAGIQLFANIPYENNTISYKTKEELKQQALKFMQTVLKTNTLVKYHVVDITDNGVKKVWIVNEELNYKLVRDGYAIVNQTDIYIPTTLKTRMIKAMNYAQSKKLGLWKTTALTQLKTNHNGCHDSSIAVTLQDTKKDILKKHIQSLPKSARLFLNSKVIASK